MPKSSEPEPGFQPITVDITPVEDFVPILVDFTPAEAAPAVVVHRPAKGEKESS